MSVTLCGRYSVNTRSFVWNVRVDKLAIYTTSNVVNASNHSLQVIPSMYGIKAAQRRFRNSAKLEGEYCTYLKTKYLAEAANQLSE